MMVSPIGLYGVDGSFLFPSEPGVTVAENTQCLLCGDVEDYSTLCMRPLEQRFTIGVVLVAISRVAKPGHHWKSALRVRSI